MIDYVKKSPFIFSTPASVVLNCVGYAVEPYEVYNFKPYGQGPVNTAKARPLGVGLQNYQRGTMIVQEAVLFGAGGIVEIKTDEIIVPGASVYINLHSGFAINKPISPDYPLYRCGIALPGAQDGYVRVVSCVPEEV